MWLDATGFGKEMIYKALAQRNNGKNGQHVESIPQTPLECLQVYLETLIWDGIDLYYCLSGHF